LATILPIQKRATGFGIFNAVFGLFWFLGSFLMGWLYDVSVVGLIIFSVGFQLISLPFFIKLSINNKNKTDSTIELFPIKKTSCPQKAFSNKQNKELLTHKL